MPSIGMRDGRVDENKTNWLHSFFFFAPIFLNTESVTEEKQEEIPFLRGQLCTHFQKHLPRVLLKSSTVGMAENQTRGRGPVVDSPEGKTPTPTVNTWEFASERLAARTNPTRSRL